MSEANESRIQSPANFAKVVKDLQGLGANALQTAAASFDRTNQETIGYIVERKLSGPRPKVLGRRTSLLARSINATPARIVGMTVQTSLGTNVEYAAVHELGIDAPVTVRAHKRKQPATVFGRRNPKDGETYQVKSHTRKMKLPARPYLSTGIADREADYFNNLEEDIDAILRR